MLLIRLIKFEKNSGFYLRLICHPGDSNKISVNAGEIVNIDAEILTSDEVQKLRLLLFLKEQPGNTIREFDAIYGLGYNKVLHIYHKLIDDLRAFNESNEVLSDEELLEKNGF